MRGTFWKIANEAIQCIEQVIAQQICILMNGNIYNFSFSHCFIQMITICNLPTYKSLVSKWRRHPPASHDMLKLALYETFMRKWDF